MIFFIGFAYISLVQWYRRSRRRQMYASVISRSLRRSSILAQRVCLTQEGSTGDFLHSALLKCSETYTVRQYVNDEKLLISTVEPKQTVDMHLWTAYMDINPSSDRSLRSIMVLLEADRPSDLIAYQKKILDTPPVCRIHVLTLGCPVAWKPGIPFGIVLHCSLDGFVAMCDAFGHGHLTVGENLEIHKIITVECQGKPHRFLQDAECEDSKVDERQQVFVFNSPENCNKMEDRKPVFVVNSPDSCNEDLQLQCESSEELVHEDIPPTVTVQKVDEASSGDTTIDDDTTSLAKDTAEVVSNSVAIDSNSVTTDNMNVNGVKTTGVTLNGVDINDTDLNGCDIDPRVRNISGSASMKPPNVLVYCGKKDSVRRFQGVKASLEQCLNTDCYTIYHLQHAEVNSAPWADNSALLIISCESLYDGVNLTFIRYFQKGGRVLSCGSSLDGEFVERKKVQNSIGVTELDIETWKGVSTLRGPFNYSGVLARMVGVVVNTMARDPLTGEPVLMFVRQKLAVTGSSGVAVLSQLLLERDPTDMVGEPAEFRHLKKSNSTRLQILKHILITLGLNCSQQTPPDLTPCVLLTNRQDVKESFIGGIQHRLKGGILRSKSLTLQFIEKCSPSTPVLPHHLPVVTGDGDLQLKYFQPQTYWTNLSTSRLGQVVLYTDVIPTTMTMFEGLQFSVTSDAGLIAIAGRQTAGKGRGLNTWLSPVGCAMFSLPVRMPADSNLGQRVSFLQHIVSLAVVQSVRALPGYEKLDLRIKWPNDIYYGQDIKLGGVIVNSSAMDNIIYTVIGCGFNVDNCNPTMCINDLVQQHNIHHGTTLDLCSVEQLIGRTVTIIEQLIDQFQEEGHEAFCRLYYDKWLHSGVKVRLESEDNLEVTVCGLDSFGFLMVQTADGQTISVQPDGNTFDMMHNLILIKKR
ncbi:biotin--protein ligase-like [Gigantopelta aegis]|uniref:biotin--protein ligase-like n=1 Tax=Gigantopelta aegis TaxID=1735272 RepID=UPI001B88A6F3|nr:biotin--protein ligase-like [Gigantopelta aegis]XP_041354802.1 biotin--protein ligase-like [Gigantopelta aegis]XP_041354803.1 biotin--protein ligase-like [Gigantopelta aegis]